MVLSFCRSRGPHDVRRGAVGVLVQEFLGARHIVEGTTLADAMGRRQSDASACRRAGTATHSPSGGCAQGSSRVLHAPTLGWRNVEQRGRLAAATGLTIHVENSYR